MRKSSHRVSPFGFSILISSWTGIILVSSMYVHKELLAFPSSCLATNHESHLYSSLYKIESKGRFELSSPTPLKRTLQKYSSTFSFSEPGLTVMHGFVTVLLLSSWLAVLTTAIPARSPTRPPSKVVNGDMESLKEMVRARKFEPAALHTLPFEFLRRTQNPDFLSRGRRRSLVCGECMANVLKLVSGVLSGRDFKRWIDSHHCSPADA